MGSPADRLLRLMYEWIQAAEECSSNLRGLAEELESLREDCNAWETVGNTAAVVGSVVSIVAAPFTGGASVALAAAVIGGAGAGVSVVTKITEQFKSSSKLERVKEIDKRCNEIADEIQDLFKELREQCPSSSAEDMDRYVIKEFLKAMSKRSNLGSDMNISDLDDLIKHLLDNAVVKTITKRLASSLIKEVLNVLSVFSLNLEGKLLSTAISTGGKQIGKAAAIKGVSRFLGGVVGLAFSLPDAINSWTEAIEDKHETEASKSLRDSAKKIDEATENLSEKLTQIKKMVRKAVNKPRPRLRPSPDPPSDDDESSSEKESSSDSSSSESESSSESSSEEEEELKTALVNARSVNKFIRQNDRALIDLIQNNSLDMLMITETWLPVDSLTNGDFRRILPSNYNVLSNPRFFRRGGGVAIVFSMDLIVRNVFFNFPDTFEYVAGSVRRRGTDEPTLFLNIYRPPEATHGQFFDELRTLLSEAFSAFRLVVLGGDFNIWVDRPDLRVSRDFQTLLDDFGLEQRVSEPTHRDGHTLDLVIARPHVRIADLSVQNNHFSDHRTIFYTTYVAPNRRSNDHMREVIGIIGKMVIWAKKKKKKKKKKTGKRKKKRNC